MLTYKKHLQKLTPDQQNHTLTYGSRFTSEPVPKYEIPQKSMPPEIAYQIIHDELALDGNAILNLASYVTTWMDDQAHRIFSENINKNYIDQDEYPQTTELQNRCVNMLARLYHSPTHETAVGTATIGSSEAIHLAGLAMKWQWRNKRKIQGKPIDKPNIVMSACVQVCWEKFARYFDVEPRFIPISPDNTVINIKEALQQVDENTIAVVGILGTTFTGEFEPIESLNQALLELNQKTGWDVPIHVDAASGGFVAPFVSPNLKWDFRLALVKSINISGHKYGLVYPGVGWVIWRDQAELPEELVFHVNYLGGEQPTFNLNFSKSASPILGQYYNFIRLGKAGYRQIMSSLQKTVHFMTQALKDMKKFNILSNPKHLPVIAFSLKNSVAYTVFEISEKLRERGWIVPAYTLPANAQAIAIIRVVVREGFSYDMAQMLIADLKKVIDYFERISYKKQSLSAQEVSKNQGIC